ncbi:MAG: hypothetical protein SV487_03965 [Thermodesulfobacteriota bacterium]|nr:hypothetical protein [Thermodesulfobacteriota bacterium]
MRGQNIVRIIALIGLCALVYYFSFDQGRRDIKSHVQVLESRLEAKERTIQGLAAEVGRLKKEIQRQKKPASAGPEPEAGRPEAKEDGRINIRLHSSEILFEQNLVLTCLGIDRSQNQAELQVNLIREDKLHVKTIKLGQGLRFSMGGQAFILILDRINSSGSVSVQLIKR